MSPYGASRDHPRSRGVYAGSSRPGSSGTGSSPLARGLRRIAPETVTDGGIIPARAGFTRKPCRRRAGAPDHPRSRGVYPTTTCTPVMTLGSSPLARGLLRIPIGDDVARRIIPARAGFTAVEMRRLAPESDHPRSRGVYGYPQNSRVPGVGSSPLARGLHLRILGIPTMSHPTRPRLPSLLT